MSHSDTPPSPNKTIACILVLPTTHHTLLAESILQAENIRYLPVPKPQKAVSDCGMAIQISLGDVSHALAALREQKLSVKAFVKRKDGGVEPLDPEPR
jgi:hypothetical protein